MVSRYSADSIVKSLSASGAVWLPADALDALLSGMLRDKRDDLAHQIIHQVSAREDFLSVIISAISVFWSFNCTRM